MFQGLTRLFIKLNRDSRVRLYKYGGFTGGLLGMPVDITLDKFPESEFKEIENIIKALKCPGNLESDDTIGDFGYTIEVGSRNASSQELKTLYNRRTFSKTPRVVIELEKKLKKHASKDDFCLKK